MTEFQRALQKVLVHEGGYSNHKEDPGGATMKGVTQRVYDAYRKSMNMSPVPVRQISASEIEAIYRQKYWNLLKGDQMPAGVGYVVFDGGVNSGVSRSVKWLQMALAPYYTGVVDGLIGPATIAAVNDHPNHDALIARICDIRMKFLRALKTFKTFGRGWTARVAGVLAVGQAWATGAEAPPVAFMAGMQAKALETDAKSAPPKALGDAAAGGGSVGTVIAQAIDQITPYATSQFVANVIVGLTIAGIVVTAGGLAYRFWAARKKAEIEEAIGP